MNAILASKLYKTSRYKAKIDSALADPVNQELVTQLSSYLDDDTIDTLKSMTPDTSSDSETDLDTNNDDQSTTSSDKTNSPPSPPSYGQHSGSSLSGRADEFTNDFSDTDDNGGSDNADVDNEPAGSDDSVESAEDIAERPVLSNSDEIMAMLNDNPTTSGINRIASKGNETWIYYNDSINMNDILTNVIECLHVDGCQDLEFNRLARSDNAVVFTSDCRGIENE